MKAYMLAVQRSNDLMRRHASFLRGRKLTIRHFFDHASMISWLMDVVRVKMHDPLHCQLHRLSRYAIGVTQSLFRLARDMDVELDLCLHWVPRTVAQTVPQHQHADQLAADAALTGFCYNLEDGNEFNQYILSPVMRFFESTVGIDHQATICNLRASELWILSRLQLWQRTRNQ